MSSDWGNVSRGELLRSIRGVIVAAVTGASLVALALLFTDKWERLGDPVIPTAASMAGVVALLAAILSERMRGWPLIIGMYALLAAGFLWLNLDDGNEEALDDSIVAAMIVVGLALAAYVVPQLVKNAAAIRARFSGAPQTDGA